MLAPWKKSYGKPRQNIKNQRHHFAHKGLYSQSFVFSSSHPWMWALDHREGWMPEDWCFLTAVLEKTLESSLNSKIKPVNPKGNQSWLFIHWRTDIDADAPILWPPDVENWLIGKDPDARKDWRPEEKGTTEDEMVGRHHWINGHEFEQALGIGDEHGSLMCCSPWCHKETRLSDWAELIWFMGVPVGG